LNKIIDKHKDWLNEPTLPKHMYDELLSISESPAELEDRFHTNLSFGTGGMRGLIGAGTNRINTYTIRRVAEGLALLIQKAGEAAMKRGVVIAYDTRHFSQEFALEVAKTVGKYNINIYLFKESRPTPELSFAIRHLNAYAGIVITASHNPAEYNGIKVYGEDGGQLSLEPTNKIVQYIDGIGDLFSISTETETVLKESGILTYILEDIDAAYENKLLTLREDIDLLTLNGKDLTIIYTPLHGSGLIPVTSGLKAYGFNKVTIVEEQAEPNPAFPTVSYPNPEEKEAFQLAIKYGHRQEADLLLATDPDADRLGVAVRKEDGQYELLSGNQLGALLLHYILSQKNKKETLPTNSVVMKTIVTSEFGRAIANKFGVPTIDTLTGFKFISEKIETYNNSGEYTFLFGYEESYGYLIGDFVRDKDAVQAALITAEMATYYKSIGKTLYDALYHLYEEIGHYRESLVSLTKSGIEGQAEIQRILTMFRNTPPSSIAGVPVIFVEDYQAQTRDRIAGVSEKIALPKADVLKFILQDNSWFCIRPSGTEPKCKFYFGVRKDSADEAELTIKKIEEEVMGLVGKLTI